VVDWPHSDGANSPRGVRGVVWGDSSFDHGARGGTEHLMPLSGQTAGAPVVEGKPRARQKFARRVSDPRVRLKSARQVLDPRARRRLT
jgi:hypothetical protein